MKENSIEEDRQILESFKNNEMQRDKLEIDGRCGGWKIGNIYKLFELNPAIEHILSDYKRVLKENEELKYKYDKALSDVVKETKKEEQLQKENEELKTELERQKDINRVINQKGLEKEYKKALEKTMTKFLKNNIDKDFIPVQKVKDKIEELKRLREKTFGLNNKLVESQIEVLQELLESE